MHFKLFFLLLAAAFLSKNLSADDDLNITMSALEFTGAIQQNHKGAFDLFIQDLEKNTPVKHDYLVAPPTRAAKQFFQKKSHCLIPSSLYPPYYQGYDVIHSDSFTRVIYLAFTRADQPIIKDKTQLSGKIIGVIKNADTWNYEQRFNIKNADYIKVSDPNTLVELLYKKRIDVAIHDHADFLALAKSLKKTPPNYHKDFPITEDKIVISCHNSPATRAYIRHINIEIKKTLATGFEQYFQQSSIN